MKVIFRGTRIRIRWPAVRAAHVASDTAPVVAVLLDNPQRRRLLPRNFALAASSLLAPCALIAFTITCWNIAASLRWTSGFFLSRGMFSHWQSWLAASLVLFLLSRVLAQCVDENDREYYT